MRLTWKEYSTFFDLWSKHGTGCMIYVIGETHHCYIGSIGSRGGKGGLKMRYQQQYLLRAQAMFGFDESAGQKAFCALFDEISDPAVILQVEALVQRQFIQAHGRGKALFRPLPVKCELALENRGSPPSFLERPKH